MHCSAKNASHFCMLNTVVNAVRCLLPCLGAWVILFRSPLLPHLVEWLVTKEPMTSSDLEDLLLRRGSFFLYGLYTCLWCQAFWTSAAAAIAYGVFFGDAWKIPLYALTVYPITSFAVWKLKHLEQH